ncbi:ogr/Delta-like zinc finger family protein [Citrobacter koseri]|uniref:ogr/Delta-like zinc finger family protein n=1 Tax=Citrobacter koseri TaxID=545 RepID=UPI001B9FFCD5|nr:ogr/Delta-like zinc finger family protein [Citrobacter koseri]WOJ06534.1 ogr/Delta-like zinc finger family protein [Citrobacter koseri]WOP82068.1 ogr/Delta-like zinc finger family protein [Citrobacter koseri]HBC6077700.1 ogr/Delta-like zinc finger family protein [Citrobacter koseri]HBC6078418.1 ogr/Delta-like zinc finger family protein [Citrobacter koseri]
MMRCPYCKQAAHVRTSRYLSDNVKQSYLQCVNVFCSTTFRTIESIDEVIRPPAEENPEPPQTIPETPTRILDCARSSQRH